MFSRFFQVPYVMIFTLEFWYKVWLWYSLLYFVTFLPFPPAGNGILITSTGQSRFFAILSCKLFVYKQKKNMISCDYVLDIEHTLKEVVLSMVRVDNPGNIHKYHNHDIHKCSFTRYFLPKLMTFFSPVFCKTPSFVKYKAVRFPII